MTAVLRFKASAAHPQSGAAPGGRLECRPVPAMRIDRQNKPILAYPDDHPAKAFLLGHRDFCNRWVAFELNHPPEADPTWHSATRGKRMTLSGVLYMYFAFTPILRGWLDQPPEPSGEEEVGIKEIAECEQLLEEARVAAVATGSELAQHIIAEAQHVLTLWRTCIVARQTRL